MLAARAIALIVLVVGYYGIRSSPVFDVAGVAVTGGAATERGVRQAKTETATEGRSLLAVDSGSIQRAVEALPAVRSATVDRSFPNELSVSIVMYHPAVAVTSGHHTYLVADDAHVIGTVKAAPPHVVAVRCRTEPSSQWARPVRIATSPPRCGCCAPLRPGSAISSGGSRT